ncbi:NTP transferase domain-containing protein [Paenibacillus sp. GCM10023248]|uniref:nucleotidyltransferase family protein n=1 Tax=unclassified Paenibacillus TaxID=185978 RepID=UPI0023797FFE|nr:nucleotidyltransferase family protein [Paenibacillus sp. MAHUQ-63]MDD9271405.1 nucleotidyltransferase family protein [Paenibacillus sp. MAHUQ-63]
MVVTLTKRKVVGVYLAAGCSRRMGTAKQSLELAPGVRLGGAALLQALHSELYAVIVVVRGDDPLDWLPGAAETHGMLGRCRLVVCPDAEQGMAHSLRTGIREAAAMGAEGIMVLLADQPFIDCPMLLGLTQAFSRYAELDYVASGDRGLPKPPLIMGPRMWPAAAALEGDVGARALLRSSEYCGQIIEEKQQLKFMDVDTVERYEEAKRIYTHHSM